MSPSAARGLYTLGWYLALPLVIAYLLLRSVRQTQYRRFWAERFLGHGPAPLLLRDEPARAGAPVLWVHAVSVGETRAAEPLVEREQLELL